MTGAVDHLYWAPSCFKSFKQSLTFLPQIIKFLCFFLLNFDTLKYFSMFLLRTLFLLLKSQASTSESIFKIFAALPNRSLMLLDELESI